MSEVRRDQPPPDQVPPDRGDTWWGRRGYGGDESAATWWWVIAIIIIALIIWWIVTAATPRPATTTGPGAGTGMGQVGTGGTGGAGGGSYGAGGAGGAAAGLTPAAVLANPNRYLGRSVTVTGVVGSTLGANAFLLNESGGGTAGQQLLVVGKRPALQSVRAGQQAQVSGAVTRFSATQMSRALGVSLKAAQFRNWDNQPAVLATTVTVLGQPSGTGGNANTGTGTGSTSNGTGSGGQPGY